MLRLSILVLLVVPAVSVKSIEGATATKWHWPKWLSGGSDKIPKLVHFMYKEALNEDSQWPNPIWQASYSAWKKHFPEPEYEYHFWTDSELAEFFGKNCGSHKSLLARFRTSLAFSDYTRICILQEHGGIYADLDYEPRTNFYEDLKPGRVNLIQSPYPWENTQNSLMASPATAKSHKYWVHLLELAESMSQKGGFPSSFSGPALLDKMEESKDPDTVHVLPCHDFQHALPNGNNFQARDGCERLTVVSYHKDVKGVHWGTWSHESFGSGGNNHAQLKAIFGAAHSFTEVPTEVQQLFKLVHGAVQPDA